MKRFHILVLIGFFISACATPPAPAATKTPQPTQSPTIRPSTTPTKIKEEFSPEDFSLPVAFSGDYALGGKLRYAPCYHWDPKIFDLKKVNENNWYEFFHAGDMHVLSVTNKSRKIVVLSPVTGKIIKVNDFGQGLMINIETDFNKNGKRVFVDVGHVDTLFPGDEKNPSVKINSMILQGQPLGISTTVWQWGRPEQAVDIGVRNGPDGANPVYSNFAPDSYIEPYLYLQDELQLYKEFIIFDRSRSHCLLSGRFPK